MDFEDKIKGIIEGASEAPDAFVWERISSTLNARARRRLYFRRGAYSVASAAAVALLLFINFDDSNVRKNSIEVVPAGKITAEVKESAIQPQASANTTIVNKVHKSKNVHKNTIEVIPAETLAAISAEESSTLKTQEPVVNEGNQSAQNKESAQTVSKPENKSKEVSKKPFRNTIADVYMPTASKKLSKFNVSAYAHINTSYENSSMNMYAPGIDLDDSKTFMAPGTQFYIESDVKYSIPKQFGVQVQLPFKNRYAISTGLTYSYLRSEVKTTPTGGESNTVITELQYIGVPLNLFYNIMSSKRLKVYASIGGMVEKGINANIIVRGMGIADSEVSSTIKPLALSVNGGMGIEYLFNKHLGIYADPGLTYFFSTDQPISIRTVEQLQFKCEVGLRLHL
jgi:hypothetical protein